MIVCGRNLPAGSYRNGHAGAPPAGFAVAAVRRRRFHLILAVAVLAMLPRAAEAQVTFVVDSVRSGIWVDAELDTGSFPGSDSDRDSTGLSGTFTLEVDDQTVRVTSGILYFADSLELEFDFGAFGSIDAATEPSVPSLELIGAGPAADLVDGAFTQEQNILEFRGVLYLEGHGFIGSSVPSDPQHVASANTLPLGGTLETVGDRYQLVIPLHFNGTFDLGGGSSAEITLDGMVYASDAFPSAIEDPAEQPAELVLADLYPNPARDRAHLAVSVARSQEVRLDVFDVRGRQVVDAVEVFVSAGRTELAIDTSHLSSGFYVATVAGATSRETISFVIVK